VCERERGGERERLFCPWLTGIWELRWVRELNLPADGVNDEFVDKGAEGHKAIQERPGVSYLHVTHYLFRAKSFLRSW
jgi:hypothetical protein